jgi:hypothetical protein
MRKKTMAWTIALVTAVVLLSLLPVLIPSPGSTAEAVVAPALLWGPYLSGTTANGTTINIRTDFAVTATVEYATEDYYLANSAYDRSATDCGSAELHHIALTGLEADAVYNYRVIYGTETTGDFHFSTFAESGPFTFIVYSDTQDQLPTFSQLDRHKLIADRIAQEPDVAFVLNSGDLVNDAANLSDWNRYFAAGGAMMANTTVFPALGNHDANNSNYYEIYGVSEWYSFDYADAHITVLDSNDWADLDAESAWLADDLQTEKPFKFLSFHHPLYTSEAKHFGGWENLREAWESDIHNNGVLAVFNGHVHAYERFLFNNTNYFVAGIGGAPSYNLATPRAEGSQNSLEYMIGYTRVTVDPATRTATAEVIRVADVSSDLKSLTVIYPQDTIFETVVMTRNGVITASAGANGTIDPSGDVAVNYGGSQTFNITPNAHYHIADVLVDGVSVGAVASYTFTGVVADHTISASFATDQPAWDMNGDYVINIGDVVAIGLRWGQSGTPGWIPQDVNRDGTVNIGDVVVIGLHWGETW